MKIEKFSKNKSKRLEQVFFIADECGLIRESLEYEVTKEDRSPYWYDPTSGRRFRFNEIERKIDISVIKMDRWCNSTLYSVELPNKLNELRRLILEYMYNQNKVEIVENKKQKRKTAYYRKSKF